MSRIRLFDAHTHLNMEEWTEEERREQLRETEEAGIFVMNAGDSASSSLLAVRLAEEYPWCFASTGIHPSYASHYTEEDLRTVYRLADHPRVRAVGEIGLDFYYGKDDKEEQIALFRKQLRFALEKKMPVMIHTRDADALTMDILKEEGLFSDERKGAFPPRPDGKGGEMPDARVQLHCYSGSAELALEYAKLGATFSLGGPITFKNGKKPAHVVQEVPLAFLMSETDAPYLTPVPYRGKPNKPMYVEYVVRRMAVLKDISYEEAAAATYENALRFFGLADSAEGPRVPEGSL